ARVRVSPREGLLQRDRRSRRRTSTPTRRLRFPFPTSPPPYPSACERVQELSHFLRREEYVVGGGGSPGDLRVVGRADEDGDPGLREGARAQTTRMPPPRSARVSKASSSVMSSPR